MKKLVFSFLFIICSMVVSKGQTVPVPFAGVDISLGAVYSPCVVDGMKNLPFMSLAVEPRMNIKGVAMELGIEAAVTAAPRRFIVSRSEYQADWFSWRAISFSGTVGYVFNRGNDFSVFIGSGLGIAQRNSDSSQMVPESGEWGLCAAPRVGVFLWNSMRVTLEYRYNYKAFEYDTFGIRLSYTIGGRLKEVEKPSRYFELRQQRK